MPWWAKSSTSDRSPNCPSTDGSSSSSRCSCLARTRRHGAQMGDMSPLYWRPGQNSAITIAGARPNSNVYLLDGTVNTDPSFNTFVISLPPDSIREFQIQTGTYTAELGAGTGQINVVTKVRHLQAEGIALRILSEQQVRLAGVHEPGRASAVLAESVRRHARRPARAPASSFSAATKGCARTQHMSNIMFVPGSAVRTRRLSAAAPIYDPLTNAREPVVQSGAADQRGESAVHPHAVSRTTRSRWIGSTRSRSRCCRSTSCSRTATIRPTTTSTRARSEFRNDSFNLRLDRSWTNGDVPVRPLQPEQ